MPTSSARVQDARDRPRRIAVEDWIPARACLTSTTRVTVAFCVSVAVCAAVAGIGAVAGVGAVAGFAGVAGAATHLVRPDGSGDFPTIQVAIDAVAPGDTIALTDGTFRGDGNRDLDPSGKDVVIRSQSGHPENCVIDCQGSESDPHRGFSFESWESAAMIVEGLTVCHGWGPFNAYDQNVGGAVLCDFALPTLQDCIFSDNGAVFGGAIMLSGPSQPLIRRCTFTGNRAEIDAACIDSKNTSAPRIEDCLFAGNTSDHRAGVMLADDYASPVILGCTFYNNHATDTGGGASGCGSADPLFRRCTFADNSAATGGAGISCSCSADALLESCIIAFSSSGPAVTALNQSTVTLSCCDLYGNAGGDWVGAIAEQCGVAGNFSEDPLFCDHAAGDLRVDGESPCLPRNHPQGMECNIIGAWGVGCPGTGVDPQVFSEAGVCLGSPWPNPSARGVEFRFSVPERDLPSGPAGPSPGAGSGATSGAGSGATAGPQADVELSIHDAAGRLVRMLLQRPLESGAHVAGWNGDDARGHPAPAGVYFVRLRCDGQTVSRPMLRLQ
jgi:hypothetical protein